MGGTSQSGIGGDKTQANWDVTLQYGDYWLVKVDGAGNKQWDKRYGGQNQDNLSKIRQTFDGGFILGGSSLSNISGDKTQNSRGGWDYWIVKTDGVGNKEWDKRFGGIYEDFLFEIQQTPDSGYIFGGHSNSPAGGDKTESNWDVANFYEDFWVVKTDKNGNKEWDKRFGGLEDDEIRSIITTYAQGYLLLGWSTSDSSGDKTYHSKGYSDYWTVKIDSSGEKEWDKSYGGNSDDYLSVSLQIEERYILLGTSYSDSSGDKTQSKWGNNFDYWLVKIDSNKNKIWDKVYGGLGEDGAYSIAQTVDKGYLLSGISYSNSGGDKTENNLGTRQTWVVKTDSMGMKKWDKTVLTTGGEAFGIAIQSLDGCYIMGGYTDGGIGGYKTQPSRGGEDYWIVKFCMDTVVGIGDEVAGDDGGIQIQVYPNPFSSDLYLSLTLSSRVRRDETKGEGRMQPVTFTITNALGQVIYKREETNLSSNYTKMLDLSYLPGGFYFITVTQNGELFTKKVVKE